MDTQTFLKKLDSIPEIPTLPNIVISVNKMLQDEDTSIKKLGVAIEKDQAMVSKILRLVNSTFYGFRSKIKNIPHAIIILGFNTVRNAVVSVSIIKTLSKEKICEGFDITDFWKHSIAVAVTSRYLAEQTKLDPPDDCFVAGLLHDIGKVILAQFFTDFFIEIMAAVQKNGLSFYEAEKELIPATHTQIGAYLAKKWQFPASLIESITYHHHIREFVSNLNQLVIVHTADIIVNNRQGDSLAGRPDFSYLDDRAKKIMFGQLETVSEWFPEIAKEIESACEFFLKGDC
ncbi:MAG TPA: HDOD domain-containing protein [Desulfatiglandales bacterium]|nr:HDOD domain-containing protein [Desulfatiglandales bacterium]